MGRRAAAIAFVGLAAALVACFGYGDPVDESGDPGPTLPERGGAADATVVDSGAGTPAPVEASIDSPVSVPDADAAKTSLRVFISSTTPSGNLGGVAGADALCNQRATAAALGGTWRAWVSVSGADAIDHITSAGPWQLVTGEVVAANKAVLTSGTLTHLIDKDEKGVTPPVAEDRVWTATGPNGRYVGPDCAQWTGVGTGVVGEARNGNTGTWSNLAPEACSEVNRIYCFEL